MNLTNNAEKQSQTGSDFVTFVDSYKTAINDAMLGAWYFSTKDSVKTLPPLAIEVVNAVLYRFSKDLEELYIPWEPNDLYQDVMLGLWKAFKSYDEREKRCSIPYVERAIKWAVLHHIYKLIRFYRPKYIKFEIKSQTDMDESPSLKIDLAFLIKGSDLLDDLSVKERVLIYYRYGRRMGHKRLSRIIDQDRSFVQKSVTSLEKKLKNTLRKTTLVG